MTTADLRQAFAELAEALKPEAGLPPLLTVEQAAKLIQVSPSTLRAQLPAYIERGLRFVVLPSTSGGSPERRNIRVLRDSIGAMCRGLELAPERCLKA